MKRLKLVSSLVHGRLGCRDVVDPDRHCAGSWFKLCLQHNIQIFWLHGDTEGGRGGRKRRLHDKYRTYKQSYLSFRFIKLGWFLGVIGYLYMNICIYNINSRMLQQEMRM